MASFFVSRVDAKADPLLPAGSGLRGRVAVASAQRAYGRYRRRFGDRRWAALREAGARPQRPLWASTATKDPAYSDVLYVERLIAPDVVNTMPESVLRAFADHGRVGRPLGVDTGTPSASSAVPRRRASTSRRSPRSSSAKGWAPSATPTARCWSGSPARRAPSPSPHGPRGAPRPGSHPPAPGGADLPVVGLTAGRLPPARRLKPPGRPPITRAE